MLPGIRELQHRFKRVPLKAVLFFIAPFARQSAVPAPTGDAENDFGT